MFHVVLFYAVTLLLTSRTIQFFSKQDIYIFQVCIIGSQPTLCHVTTYGVRACACMRVCVCMCICVRVVLACVCASEYFFAHIRMYISNYILVIVMYPNSFPCHKKLIQNCIFVLNL